MVLAVYNNASDHLSGPVDYSYMHASYSYLAICVDMTQVTV